MVRELMISSASRPLRVKGIDTVRAFAALSVMLAHILGPVMPDIVRAMSIDYSPIVEISKYLFTGHPAVIAFFVVSGFCIHYPYTKSQPPVLAFWIARLIRILIPALFAIYLAKKVGIKNYNFWDGYILWSIVCELFYYMMYPAFFYLTRFISWGWQTLFSFALSYGLVFTFGSDEFGNAHIYGPYLNWVVALPSWLMGCFLAEIISSQGTNKLSQTKVFHWRIMVALTASLLSWLTTNTWLGYYLTMNLFSILIFFWLRVEIYYSQYKTNWVLETIGKWTYSIYLFHMIGLSLTLFLTKSNEDMQWRLMALPVVLFICYVFYQVVEKQSHRLARLTFDQLTTNKE